jgi:Na+-translocating ferredoxin:NAD+ oxidoreductase RnfC subunit
VDYAFSPRSVKVLLKQHAGVPAVPVVKCGDRVRAGDLLAAPPQGKLGARVHASIAGVVTVTGDAVVIEA